MAGNLNDDLDLYYPYHPAIAAQIVFLITFMIFGLIFTYQSLSTKKYYLLIMALFAFTEGGGYIARLLFAEVYKLKNTYLAQIIILVLAPNFIQAFMYTETADLIKWSHLDPDSLFKKYGTNLPTYFILTDLLCLFIQGAAGGVMGSPNATKQDVDNGRIVILIGLILQLASLFLFGFVLVSFVQAIKEAEKQKLTYFLYSLYIGISLVIIRNGYRIAEFANGSMNSGPMNEKEVYILLADATAMWLSCFFFAIWSVAYLPENIKYEGVPNGSNNDNVKQVVVASKSPETEMVSIEAAEAV